MGHIEKATAYIIEFFEAQVDQKYVYHNLEHTLGVLASTQEISEKSKLSEEDFLAVQFAALFHDTGFNDGPENHEARSADIAEAYLKDNGFEESLINKVRACILSTRLDFDASEHLSQILQDADMSGLASSEFPTITERLRQEKNNTENAAISKEEWDDTNIKFLKQCNYKTIEAKSLYQAKKEQNLKSLIKKNTKKLKKKDKKKSKIKVDSISNNKSAQTQFKTALRNHIDLSNIADNKANIMISVNALILTVALPFLIEKSMDNHNFLLPTIILSMVCLISMIYATLATRPIKMSGMTSMEQITRNKSNLFFFGNYHKMDYEDYKTGVGHLLSNPTALEDSIIRDLFYLGKSLGAKFDNLRLCYNIFMYGISITVLSILIVFFV